MSLYRAIVDYYRENKRTVFGEGLEGLAAICPLICIPTATSIGIPTARYARGWPDKIYLALRRSTTVFGEGFEGLAAICPAVRIDALREVAYQIPVSGFGFGVWGLGFRVYSFRVRMWGLGFGVDGGLFHPTGYLMSLLETQTLASEVANSLPGRSFCISQLKAKIENRTTRNVYLVSKVDRFVGELTFTKSPPWQCNLATSGTIWYQKHALRTIKLNTRRVEILKAS